MAGRAGRRGLDPVGTVAIACWDDVPPLQDLHTMLKGEARKLQSQFRLTYTMMLNLLRVEDMTVEDMIKKSFSEVETQRVLGKRDLPKIVVKAEQSLQRLKAKEEAEGCLYGGEMAIEQYYNDKESQLKINAEIMEEVMKSRQGASLLKPGNTVVASYGDLGSCVGVILKVIRSDESQAPSSLTLLLLCPPAFKVPHGSQLDVVTAEVPRDLSDWEAFSRENSKSKRFDPGMYKLVSDRILTVVKVSHSNVLALCKEKAKVDSSLVIDKCDLVELSKLVSFLVDLVKVQVKKVHATTVLSR